MKTLCFYLRWTWAVLIAYLFITINTGFMAFICYLVKGSLYGNQDVGFLIFVAYILSTTIAFSWLYLWEESINKGFN